MCKYLKDAGGLPRTQRGLISTVWLYAAGAAVALVALWFAYNTVDSRGYERGSGAVKLEWAEANRVAEEREREARAARLDILEAERIRADAAEVLASEANRKWQEARNEAKGKIPLGACPKQSIPSGDSSGTLVAGVASELLVSWQFVGLYDSAWTSTAGQPVFGTVAEVLARAQAPDPAAPSPYDLGAVLDNHKANADRCSEISRQYTEVLRTVRELSKDWEKRFGTNP